MTSPKYNTNFQNNKKLLTTTRHYNHLKLCLMCLIIISQYRTLFEQSSFLHQL